MQTGMIDTKPFNPPPPPPPSSANAKSASKPGTGTGTDAASSAAGTSTSAPATKKPSSTLDKNAFLQLLVAQLQNQDPTQSQDPNQMVQQMTSFSSLEQMQNTNALLTGLQSQNNGIYQAGTANLIGKNVQVSSPTLNLVSGKAALGVNLASPASNVNVTIQNSSGVPVATLKTGAMEAGTQSIPWNGRDEHGNHLPDGTYTVSVAAVGANGSPVTATPSTSATVTAVSFVNGAVMVTAGGQQVALADINKISS